MAEPEVKSVIDWNRLQENADARHHAAEPAHTNGVTPENVPTSRLQEQMGSDRGINITFAEDTYDIRIDLDAISWQDAKRYQRVQAGRSGLSDDEAEAMVDELILKVTGQDPNTLPARVVRRVLAVVFGDNSGN